MIEIIIPAYNCSETLKRTLASLETQIDKNFCVTIVDDCSDEPIKDIAELFSDSINIKYIRNNENLGCGMTRQKGIDNSKSDYIMFLDSDDILMPYAVSSLNESVGKYEPQIISSRFYICTDRKLKTVYDKTHCHGKLYNRKFLAQFDIRESPKIKYADDSYFNLQCFELAKDKAVLNIPLYIWMINENSLTHSDDYKNNYISDFIQGMRLASLKVLRHRELESLSYIDSTIDNIKKMCQENSNCLSNSEKSKIRKEINLFGKAINREIELDV